MSKIDEAPAELADSIREFFPPDQWDNAAAVAQLESGWNAFALNDSASAAGGCGKFLRMQDGVAVQSERSVGWFQINGCNLPPEWNWQHLYNTRHNVGTAHDLWSHRGWQPWLFSARQLGLL